MHRLSVVQALSLWQSLEGAYRGESGFGGHTTELYVYRIMSRSPSAEAYLRDAGRNFSPGSYVGDEGRRVIRECHETLFNLLTHFAEERKAFVEIETRPDKFNPLGPWLKTYDECHRFHIRITPQEIT